MQNTNTTQATFLVAETLVAEAQRRIAKVSKQAAKLGKDWTPTLTVGAKRACGPTNAIRVPITVEFPAVILNDWQIIGRANLLNKGEQGRATITRLVRGLEISEDAWNVTDKCDHCSVRRNRKAAYVLRHRTDGRIVHVGTTCVKDFVQASDMTILDALEALVSWGEHEASQAEEAAKSEEPRFTIVDFLSLACEASERYGYVKHTNANERATNPSTLQLVREFRNGERADSEGNREMAAVISDWMLSGWMRHGSDTGNEYLRNLSAIAQQVALTRSELEQHMELIVSAVGAFQAWSRDATAFHARMDAWQDKREAAAEMQPADSDVARGEIARDAITGFTGRVFWIGTHKGRPSIGLKVRCHGAVFTYSENLQRISN